MNIHTLAQTHVMTIISVSGTVRHCTSERNKINVDFKLTYVDEYIKVRLTVTVFKICFPYTAQDDLELLDSMDPFA